MNGKQVKKWAVISIILCYVFLMVPQIVSKLHCYVLVSSIEPLHFVTVGDTMEKIVVSVFMLSLLILLIYSDEILERLEKTRIGKWINTPVRGYKKWK